VIVCASAVGFCIRPLLFRTDGTGPDKKARPRALGAPLAAVPSLKSSRPSTVDEARKELFEVAERLVERFPESAHAAALMAQLQYFYGQTVLAVQWWERCLKLDEGSANAYQACVNIAWIAMERGEHEKAAALAQKALAIHPASAEAYGLLANALLDSGKPAEAVAVLEKNSEACFGSAECRGILGKAYGQLKHYEKARQHYQAAVQIDPTSAPAWYGIATACLRLGQKEQAADYLEKFKRLKAGHEKMDRQQRGITQLEFIIQRLARAHVEAGQVYSTHGEPQQAEAHWLRAVALAPANVEGRRALASLYRSQGRGEEAFRVLREFSNGSPSPRGHR
jgi:tetratricopeptide (TPR) repeat protein